MGCENELQIRSLLLKPVKMFVIVMPIAVHANSKALLMSVFSLSEKIQFQEMFSFGFFGWLLCYSVSFDFGLKGLWN